MIDGHIAFAASSLIEACEDGDAFEQRGFACAILAHDDCDGAVEVELEAIAEERQGERIG